MSEWVISDVSASRGGTSSYWMSVAIDGSGGRIVAGAGFDDDDYPGNLVTGEFSGGSWTFANVSGGAGNCWTQVAIDGNGTRIVAGFESDGNDQLMTGAITNGNTWTLADASAGNWNSVAIDGTQIVAGSGSKLITGNLSGSTWTFNDASGYSSGNLWTSVAIDNTHIVAGSTDNGTGNDNGNGKLVTGELSGNTWIFADASGYSSGNNWNSAAIDDTHIVAGSTDKLVTGELSGNTWIFADASGYSSGNSWNSVAIDGPHIVAGSTNKLVTGHFNNGSWTFADVPGTSGIRWRSVAIDGTRIVAGSYYGNASIGKLLTGYYDNGSWTFTTVPYSTGVTWKSVAIAGTRFVACSNTRLVTGALSTPDPDPDTETPLSLSYIIGPTRSQSSLTEFRIGNFIRKPRGSQLDYESRILQHMSAAQSRQFS